MTGSPIICASTARLLPASFSGRIKRWNDPALKKLNKGKPLPDLAITVIHRSDNSGTTYNLTDYLSSVSQASGRARSVRE